MKSIGVILLLCCGAVQLAFSQTTLEPPVDCSDIGDSVQAITGQLLMKHVQHRVHNKFCFDVLTCVPRAARMHV